MIDIKELRVGSHVSIGGERYCVSDVSFMETISVFHRIDKDGFKHTRQYTAEAVEPIPITEGLLAELGFVKTERRPYHRGKTEYIDAESASRKRGMYECCAPKVVLFYGAETWCVSATNERGVSYNTFVRHLHELENFVYFVRKQEIEEINGKDGKEVQGSVLQK